MKLTIVCALALLWMGAGSVAAQTERRDYSQERMKLRAAWMALDMAERYGLDEKQVEQLTAANLEWLSQMGTAQSHREWGRPRGADRRWQGRRPHHPAGRGHGCCEAAGPRMGQAPCAPCPEGPRVGDCPCVKGEPCTPVSEEERTKLREEHQKAREQRQAARQAYDEKVRKILTDEQYKAYQDKRRRP